MKTTKYFDLVRNRPDRSIIKNEWVKLAIEKPEKIQVQSDGRLRKWAKIEEMKGRYLRVVLLEDGETVHNVFFDRRYKP